MTGALGFWAALRGCDGLRETREQRCWVHKIANVLDKLPKRLQPKAKEMLHEMMRAESQTSSEKERVQLEKLRLPGVSLAAPADDESYRVIVRDGEAAHASH